MAKIGFVSLGCPKALVDSEQILSRLKALGYETSPSYEEAELVIVNTCGFINEAVEESLEAIGEALKENGKVVVTGCLGARPEKIRERHPQVLAITGPGEVERVLEAVQEVLPAPRDPFLDLTETLGIGPGEVTPDGLFSVQKVECLGSCHTAPVIQVNDEPYVECVTRARLEALLAGLRAGKRLEEIELPGK